jgi:hypothetical protein
VEPQPQPTEGVLEPPPPFFLEPPLPPPLPLKSPPRNAFWVGVRASFFVPFGNLWLDGYPSQPYYYRSRRFADYASPGAAGEVDVGARLGRHYNVFALYEHAVLGTGSLDNHHYGGQELGASNLYGLGFRFSTDPTDLGFLMEIDLGYRDFRAYFGDGTQLTATDGWLDARLGLGIDIRVSRSFSLSPMIVFGGGSFGTIRWSGPSASGSALTAYDQSGGYGTFNVQLGAHADVL